MSYKTYQNDCKRLMRMAWLAGLKAGNESPGLEDNLEDYWEKFWARVDATDCLISQVELNAIEWKNG